MPDSVTLASSEVVIDFSARTGGAVTRLRSAGPQGWTDIMRPATTESLEISDPQSMACFTSIPYVSRLYQGRFEYEGVTYDLPPNQPPAPHPLHGVIWRRPADISHITDNRIAIRHRIDEADMPYRFTSEQIWSLSGPNLHISMCIKNQGMHALPYGMGLHPFFRKTKEATIRAGVAAMVVNDAAVMPTNVQPLPALQNFSDQPRRVSDLPFDNCFTGWNQQCALAWPELGMSLNMTASSEFGYFVFCNPDDTDWFCANPVSHFNDAHNNRIGLPETGLVRLSPGESLRGEITMRFDRL